MTYADSIKEIFATQPPDMECYHGPKYRGITFMLNTAPTGNVVFHKASRQPHSDKLKQFIAEVAVTSRARWRKNALTCAWVPGLIEVKLLHFPPQPATKIKPQEYPGVLIVRAFDTHGPVDQWFGADSGRAKPDKRGLWAESYSDRYVIEVTIHRKDMSKSPAA